MTGFTVGRTTTKGGHMSRRGLMCLQWLRDSAG